MTERNDYLDQKIVLTIDIERIKRLINYVERMNCTDINIYSNGQIGFNTDNGYYLDADFNI